MLEKPSLPLPDENFLERVVNGLLTLEDTVLARVAAIMDAAGGWFGEQVVARVISMPDLSDPDRQAARLDTKPSTRNECLRVIDLERISGEKKQD